MATKKTYVISTVVSENFKGLIDKYIALDTHLNTADFLREAAREKIDKDAPQLRKKLFEQKEVV